MAIVSSIPTSVPGPRDVGPAQQAAAITTEVARIMRALGQRPYVFIGGPARLGGRVRWAEERCADLVGELVDSGFAVLVSGGPPGSVAAIAAAAAGDAAVVVRNPRPGSSRAPVEDDRVVDVTQEGARDLVAVSAMAHLWVGELSMSSTGSLREITTVVDGQRNHWDAPTPITFLQPGAHGVRSGTPVEGLQQELGGPPNMLVTGDVGEALTHIREFYRNVAGVRILPPGAGASGNDPVAMIHVRREPTEDEMRRLHLRRYGDRTTTPLFVAPYRGDHREVIELLSGINRLETAPSTFSPLPPWISPVYGIDDLTAARRIAGDRSGLGL